MNFFSPITFPHWECVMVIHKLKIFYIRTMEVGLMVLSSQVLIQGLICKGASSLWQPWELPAFQISVNAGTTSNVQVWKEKGKHCLFLLLLHGLPYSLSLLLLLPVKTPPLFYGLQWNSFFRLNSSYCTESFLITPSFTGYNQFPHNQR